MLYKNISNLNAYSKNYCYLFFFFNFINFFLIGCQYLLNNFAQLIINSDLKNNYS